MSFTLRTSNWHDNYATIREGTYPDGSTKLTVVNRYNRIMCDVTISLLDMGETPAEGCVFMRGYGDTQEVFRELQKLGVVGTTIRVIETGRHTRDPLLRRAVYECKLLNSDL